jgi:hypothetical protein
MEVNFIIGGRQQGNITEKTNEKTNNSQPTQSIQQREKRFILASNKQLSKRNNG